MINLNMIKNVLIFVIDIFSSYLRLGCLVAINIWKDSLSLSLEEGVLVFSKVNSNSDLCMDELINDEK